MSSPRREQLVVDALPATRGTKVAVRGHELIVDEAERYGGHDSGANPVEHMLAGIAAASLVVLRLHGEDEIAESAPLRISACLNVDRVMDTDDAAVFELIGLHWEVESELHAERLRTALPHIARRRPGQALIDAASAFSEEISIRQRAAAEA